MKKELSQSPLLEKKFKGKYKEDEVVFENILEECYELDSNADPARCRLKYLDKIFPEMNQKV